MKVVLGAAVALLHVTIHNSLSLFHGLERLARDQLLHLLHNFGGTSRRPGLIAAETAFLVFFSAAAGAGIIPSNRHFQVLSQR